MKNGIMSEVVLVQDQLVSTFFPYFQYGNMGCQVSKEGIQNNIGFWPKIKKESKEIIYFVTLESGIEILLRKSEKFQLILDLESQILVDSQNEIISFENVDFNLYSCLRNLKTHISIIFSPTTI